MRWKDSRPSDCDLLTSRLNRSLRMRRNYYCWRVWAWPKIIAPNNDFYEWTLLMLSEINMNIGTWDKIHAKFRYVVQKQDKRPYLHYTEDIHPGGLKGRQVKPKWWIIILIQTQPLTACCFPLEQHYTSSQLVYSEASSRKHLVEHQEDISYWTKHLSGFWVCGIKGYKTNHSLKATATRLYSAGIDEQLVMERTGHRSIEGIRSKCILSINSKLTFLLSSLKTSSQNSPWMENPQRTKEAEGEQSTKLLVWKKQTLKIRKWGDPLERHLEGCLLLVCLQYYFYKSVFSSFCYNYKLMLEHKAVCVRASFDDGPIIYHAAIKNVSKQAVIKMCQIEV